MASERKRRPNRGPAAVVVALLLGWVLVVVVGAGQRPAESPLLGVANVGLLLFGLVVLAALLGLLLIIYLKPEREDSEAKEKKPKQPWFFLIGMVLLFALWRPSLFDAFRELAEQNAAESVREEQVEEVAPEPAADSVAQATDIMLILLAIGAAAGTWYVARNRAAIFGAEPIEDSALDRDQEFEAELLVAMDQAVDDLTQSVTPRQGVLNAYASLERVLASQDKPRGASETPSEHIRRSVGSLRVDPEPLVELGGLYEIARFSDRDISHSEQEQARAALARARAELAAFS